MDTGEDCALLLARYRAVANGARETDGRGPEWPTGFVCVDKLAWFDSEEGRRAQAIWRESSFCRSDTDAACRDFLSKNAHVEALNAYCASAKFEQRLAASAEGFVRLERDLSENNRARRNGRATPAMEKLLDLERAGMSPLEIVETDLLIPDPREPNARRVSRSSLTQLKGRAPTAATIVWQERRAYEAVRKYLSLGVQIRPDISLHHLLSLAEVFEDAFAFRTGDDAIFPDSTPVYPDKDRRTGVGAIQAWIDGQRNVGKRGRLVMQALKHFEASGDLLQWFYKATRKGDLYFGKKPMALGAVRNELQRRVGPQVWAVWTGKS